MVCNYNSSDFHEVKPHLLTTVCIIYIFTCLFPCILIVYVSGKVYHSCAGFKLPVYIRGIHQKQCMCPIQRYSFINFISLISTLLFALQNYIRVVLSSVFIHIKSIHLGNHWVAFSVTAVTRINGDYDRDNSLFWHSKSAICDLCKGAMEQ